jgi:hypothetical protein
LLRNVLQIELKAARAGFYIPTVRINPFGIHTSSELDAYSLLPAKIVDGVRNTSSFVYDYVALQAKLSIDPNRNQRAIAFDALRRVVGEAVAGKVGENSGDSLEGFQPQLTKAERKKFTNDPEDTISRSILKNAGSRIIYGAANCQGGSWTPAFQAVISRDQHSTDMAQLGVDIIYFNGSGEPAQATALENPQRWRCSGRTLRDNKGLLVRKFLPFFSKSHTFQPQSPSTSDRNPSTTIFPDALDRVVGILNADHTWSKIRRTPWLTEVFDTGDTVLIGNPTTDADIGIFFNALEEESYMPSWYDRASKSNEKRERAAARKSTVYSETPEVTHTDSLGRTIDVVKDNVVHGKYTTRIDFDLLGNVSRVTNARGVVVTKTCFDMCGRELYRLSADSGERWIFSDCLGQLILMRDARNTRRLFGYDAIRRLEAEWLIEGPHKREILVSKFVFGESQPNASDHNLRMKLYQRYDQAGLAQNNEFDFKGNCVSSQTQLAEDYKGLLDWSGVDTSLPQLEPTIFQCSAEYNARNQAHTTISADGSQSSRTYNIGGELQVLVFDHYAATNQRTVFISNAVYAPDGKREMVIYGNGAQKISKFNAASGQLEQTQVKRNAPNGRTLRDMAYTYDCCGRTSNTYDAAVQDIYFRNSVIEPMQDFTYDAIGQIVEAHGREQIDVSNGRSTMRPYSPSTPSARLPGNGSQMCEYAERYIYDSVGNILAQSHEPASDISISGWTRGYFYNEKNYVDPSDGPNDQISSTKVGSASENYGYDQ